MAVVAGLAMVLGGCATEGTNTGPGGRPCIYCEPQTSRAEDGTSINGQRSKGEGPFRQAQGPEPVEEQLSQGDGGVKEP